jgi:AraC-like DNA-binding protein
MDPDLFSTRTLPERHQLDAWRGWFGGVFEVRPESPGERFIAESRTWAPGGFILSRVHAPSIRVTRTRELLRREPVDHWVIAIGNAPTEIRCNGDVGKVPPQAPFLMSLGDELVSARATDERLHLYLARDDFACIAAQLDAARGTALASPLGELLAEHMLLLERTLPLLSPEEAARLGTALQAMVAACIAPTPDRMAAAAPQIAFQRLERMRRAVQRHLRLPALGSELLCRELGTSRSQLYRLMEREGGVAHYVQRQRLRAAFQALSDPDNPRSIASVAEEFCFADAATFSRSFRQKFGISPSEARAGAAPQHLPPPEGAVRLAGWLRGI